MTEAGLVRIGYIRREKMHIDANLIYGAENRGGSNQADRTRSREDSFTVAKSLFSAVSAFPLQSLQSLPCDAAKHAVQVAPDGARKVLKGRIDGLQFVYFRP